MKKHFRTDLASEEIARINENDIFGVKSSVEEIDQISIEKTKIDKEHDERIHKKPGMYYTIHGYYALETGKGTSNVIEQQVIGTIQVPITPPPTIDPTVPSTPEDQTDLETNIQENTENNI